MKDNENYTFQQKLQTLSASKNDNYSLWKMTKKLKRPQQTVPPLRSQNAGWVKGPLEKAELFAKHLSQVFIPNTSVMKDFEDEIDAFINSDQQLSLPIKPVTPREISFFIKQLGTKKAPGYDLITGEIMHHLPRKPIVLLTMLINAILRIHYYPKLWKISQICMIPKPGKPPTETSSYRPIRLLPTISKLFEKIFLSRLKPVLDEENIIPNHQFGFRQNHSTVEQVHRVVNKIISRKKGILCCSLLGCAASI